MKIRHYGTDLLTIFVLVVSALISWLPITNCAAAADSGDFHILIEQSENIPELVKKRALAKTQIPNPHWVKDACRACHNHETEITGTDLKAPGESSCYFCHQKEDHLIPHPVSVTPGEDMLNRMPENYKQNLSANNSTNCLTCHNILMQCTKQSTVMQRRNKDFLRGGYFKTRTGACFQCHEKSAYKRLNAHDQIDDDGKLDENKCLICHQTVPEQNEQGESTKAELIITSNLSSLCLNCHTWLPHPGGNMMMFSGGSKPPDHLVKPGSEFAQRLKTMSARNNITMPLETPNGKIYCATCHNPHERGVIKNTSLAKGADEKKRLRSNPICINCHDK